MAEIAKSPIKDKPLRLPAQSLMERREALLQDKFVEPLLMALFLSLLAGWEWYRHLSKVPPAPLLASFIAALALAFAVWRFFRVRSEARNLRLAIDGEMVVGQFLERLRADGYHVFHDIIGNNFNLDHVIIGPAGVLTIETKTRSKPADRNDARVRFDGESISVDQFKPDRNPVIQAKAQGSWLRRILEESTGKKFQVRPVIVFPGWYVERAEGTTNDVWALEPKQLPGFLANEARILSEEDVRLASFHLSRFIRSQERER